MSKPPRRRPQHPDGFDILRSGKVETQNVKAVEVLWPAPRRLPEAGLNTIGYDRDVILPLRVKPQDEARPVTLQIKLDYAICEKLCVPAQAKADLVLAGGRTAQDAALAAAEARVPRKAALGAGVPRAIRAVRREDVGRRPRVLGDVAVPRGACAGLVAQGPTEERAIAVPAGLHRGSGGPPRIRLTLRRRPAR